MDDKKTGNGWEVWSKHIQSELGRLNTSYENLHRDLIISQRQAAKEISLVRVEIAMLKVKSGVWGAAGAMIPVGIMLAMQLLLK